MVYLQNIQETEWKRFGCFPKTEEISLSNKQNKKKTKKKKKQRWSASFEKLTSKCVRLDEART